MDNMKGAISHFLDTSTKGTAKRPSIIKHLKTCGNGRYGGAGFSWERLL